MNNNERKLSMMHDHWLQSGNPAEKDEEPICKCCGDFMNYEEDVDVDEDFRPFVSGASWYCVNPNCEKLN